MSRKTKRRPRVPGTPNPKPRAPGWKVNLVGFGFCDEPGCTTDHSLEDPAEAFACTSGLHQRHRLPELHMPAAPGEGEAEPLPMEEVHWILNGLADGVVSRTYHPGERVTITNVYGTIVCTLGEPVPRDDVQAFVAHPMAEVIPVTWVRAEHKHARKRCLVIGKSLDTPITFITWSAAKVDAADSGFILEHEFVYDDPAQLKPHLEDMGVFCMGCLIEHHPEVGPGLDLAREYGSARFDAELGRWVGDGEGWRKFERAVERAREAER